MNIVYITIQTSHVIPKDYIHAHRDVVNAIMPPSMPTITGFMSNMFPDPSKPGVITLL
jgi:hypothetical protein